jgi:hypothetical protein
MKIRMVSMGLALLLLLPAAAVAAQRNSGNMNLASPAMVGQTRLQAGRYKVEWNGNGPNVQARFLDGNKTVATAPATLVRGTSPYSNAVDVKTLPNKTNVLKDIYWKHVTLKFGRSS